MVVKTEKGANAADLAKLLERIETFLDAEGGFEKVAGRVKALEDFVGGFGDTDPKDVLTEFDKIKAAQKTLEKAIRNSRKGYVSGLEDVDFKLSRALVGRKIGWEKAGAEHEHEVIRQVMEKHPGLYPKAAHTAGDDATGGDWIPDQVIADIIAAIYTRSVWFNMTGEGTTRVTLYDGLRGTGSVKIPKFDGGVIAYWLGEEDEYAESQVRVGDVTLTPHKLGALVRLTEDLLNNVAYGFEARLRQDMIRAMAKKFDWTIMYGTGGDMPVGFVNDRSIDIFRAETGTRITRDAAEAVSDWDGGVFNFDTLEEMALLLEEDDIEPDGETFTTVTSRRLISRMKRFKVDHYGSQTTNQAYLIGPPMITGARMRELIGDYATSNQIPSNNLPGASIGGTTDSTNEKYTDVFFGNPRTIAVGRWMGLEMFDDIGKAGPGWLSEHAYIRVRMRVDVKRLQPRNLLFCPDALARN